MTANIRDRTPAQGIIPGQTEASPIHQYRGIGIVKKKEPLPERRGVAIVNKDIYRRIHGAEPGHVGDASPKARSAVTIDKSRYTRSEHAFPLEPQTAKSHATGVRRFSGDTRPATAAPIFHHRENEPRPTGKARLGKDIPVTAAAPGGIPGLPSEFEPVKGMKRHIPVPTSARRSPERGTTPIFRDDNPPGDKPAWVHVVIPANYATTANKMGFCFKLARRKELSSWEQGLRSDLKPVPHKARPAPKREDHRSSQPGLDNAESKRPTSILRKQSVGSHQESASAASAATTDSVKKLRIEITKVVTPGSPVDSPDDKPSKRHNRTGTPFNGSQAGQGQSRDKPQSKPGASRPHVRSADGSNDPFAGAPADKIIKVGKNAKAAVESAASSEPESGNQPAPVSDIVVEPVAHTDSAASPHSEHAAAEQDSAAVPAPSQPPAADSETGTVQFHD